MNSSIDKLNKAKNIILSVKYNLPNNRKVIIGNADDAVAKINIMIDRIEKGLE